MKQILSALTTLLVFIISPLQIFSQDIYTGDSHQHITIEAYHYLVNSGFNILDYDTDKTIF